MYSAEIHHVKQPDKQNSIDSPLRHPLALIIVR